MAARSASLCPGILGAVLLALLATGSAGAAREKGVYAKWLDGVEARITPEEKKEWKALASDADRAEFITRFWAIRTPTGADPEAVRREHERRVTYANERFSAGYLGSRTDRGRLYIQLGPPTTISRITPGTRRQPGSMEDDPRVARGDINRLGGQDRPGEVWTYRFVAGAVTSPNELQFLFIDCNFSGNYELAYDFGDPDRLALISSDPVLTAEMGSAISHLATAADMVGIDREQKREVTDRRELTGDISQTLSYSPLTLRTSHAFFRGADGKTFVPYVVEIPNREMGFGPVGESQVGTLDLRGRILAAGDKVASEFSGTARIELDAEQWKSRLELRHQVQAGALLTPGHYLSEVVALDRQSGKVGMLREPLNVPAFSGSDIALSSIVLASRLERINPAGAADAAGPRPAAERAPFVFGDTEVVPLGSEDVRSSDRLGIYFQVYAPGLRDSCTCPDLEVEYTLRRGGITLRRLGDPKHLDHPVTGPAPMVSVGRMVDLGPLVPGGYEIAIRVGDGVRKRTLEGTAKFDVR